MNPESEIRRLLDVLPASGRMMVKIINKPSQPTVIESPFPYPWSKDRSIFINFDLWQRLSKPQRDLLILRTVSRICAIKWFKLGIEQFIVLVSIAGLISEIVEKDVVGIGLAGSLGAIVLTKIWRNNQRNELELEADEAAIKVAQRRGYTEETAARYLLEAVEIVAQIEGRYTLNFTELIRCQNLRSIAGLSLVTIPDRIREEQN